MLRSGLYTKAHRFYYQKPKILFQEHISNATSETKALIGIALALALCFTLSKQQLLEKHLENHLLNANALQMLSGQCSHMNF